MKKLGIFVLIMVIILGTLYFSRNYILRAVLTGTLKKTAGVEAEIDEIDLSLFGNFLSVTGFRIFNPSGFKDREMISIPEVYVKYIPSSLWKRPIHLVEVKLNLGKVTVIRGKEGGFNLEAFKEFVPGKSRKVSSAPTAEKAGKETVKEELPVKIDLLSLHIGKIIYKDYSKEPVQTKEINLDFSGEYKNIDNFDSIRREIMSSVINKLAASALAGTGILPVETGIKDTITGAAGAVKDVSSQAVEATRKVVEGLGDVAGSAVKTVTDTLKDILPAGEGTKTGEGDK